MKRWYGALHTLGTLKMSGLTPHVCRESSTTSINSNRNNLQYAALLTHGSPKATFSAEGLENPADSVQQPPNSNFTDVLKLADT